MNYSTEGAQSQSESDADSLSGFWGISENPIAFSKPICYNKSVNQVMQA